MTVQTLAGTSQRVGIIKGEMLAISEPQEVLTLGVSYKKFPKNRGDVIKYRARIPTGGATTNTSTINRWSITASTYVTTEGSTPAAKTVAYRDVSAQQVQYAVLYAYSDKAADLHEDDIPEDQKVQCAEEMGLVREMVRYGEMKAATNAQYVGGTTRATVASAISYNALSLMARTLLANGGRYKTRMLAPGPEYDTSAIEAAFIVFHHTDCRHDVRQLQDFVSVAKYANRKPIHPNEYGSVGEFRFISSKELQPYASAGVAIGATGLVSAANDNVDVYPFIVCGEDAVFDIALNLNFSVHHIPVSLESKDDPLAQRGYVGTKWYQVTKAVNGGWFGVIEAGVTNLS